MADPDSMHNAELQCCEWHPQSTVAVFCSLSANEHDVITHRSLWVYVALVRPQLLKASNLTRSENMSKYWRCEMQNGVV